MRYRRLARDYERTTASSEAMSYWATVIMTRRLARYETGTPPEPRWGQERTRPGQPDQVQTARPRLSTGSKQIAHLEQQAIDLRLQREARAPNRELMAQLNAARPR